MEKNMVLKIEMIPVKETPGTYLFVVSSDIKNRGKKGKNRIVISNPSISKILNDSGFREKQLLGHGVFAIYIERNNPQISILQPISFEKGIEKNPVFKQHANRYMQLIRNASNELLAKKFPQYGISRRPVLTQKETNELRERKVEPTQPATAKETYRRIRNKRRPGR